MMIRWEPAGAAPVRYFVDDEPVGAGDAGFDHVLERVAAGEGPVTVRVTELSLGGEDLVQRLPFADRMDELRERLAGRPLRYDLL